MEPLRETSEGAGLGGLAAPEKIKPRKVPRLVLAAVAVLVIIVLTLTAAFLRFSNLAQVRSGTVPGTEKGLTNSDMFHLNKKLDTKDAKILSRKDEISLEKKLPDDSVHDLTLEMVSALNEKI